MKQTPLIAILALALFASAASAQTRNVTLRWDYPAIADDTARARLEFKLHGTTDLNLPQDQWPVVATIPGTNISATVVSQTEITLPVQPAAWFFYVTANDSYWSIESVPSNSVNTPAPVVAANPFGLVIFRTP
jgi:hypothetical protein